MTQENFKEFCGSKDSRDPTSGPSGKLALAIDGKTVVAVSHKLDSESDVQRLPAIEKPWYLFQFANSPRHHATSNPREASTTSIQVNESPDRLCWLSRIDLSGSLGY